MSSDAAARDLVRAQFGPNAANYATSVVHAKGASLGRLVDLMPPDPAWRLLDIAAAAGHTGFAFAPLVDHVVISDLLDEMLAVARSRAEELGLDNVSFETADAESLPFEDGSFDAVTCRIAPHHFPNPDRFVAEVVRVLRPGGFFGLVDNMVDEAASSFVNGWEKKRDPSHVLALSVEQWAAHMIAAGLELVSVETMAKRMDFEAWTTNMNVPEALRAELLAELEAAPAEAVAYLRPELGQPGDQSAAAFHLTEGLLVGRRPNRTPRLTAGPVRRGQRLSVGKVRTTSIRVDHDGLAEHGPQFRSQAVPVGDDGVRVADGHRQLGCGPRRRDVDPAVTLEGGDRGVDRRSELLHRRHIDAKAEGQPDNGDPADPGEGGRRRKRHLELFFAAGQPVDHNRPPFFDSPVLGPPGLLLSTAGVVGPPVDRPMVWAPATGCSLTT